MKGLACASLCTFVCLSRSCLGLQLRVLAFLTAGGPPGGPPGAAREEEAEAKDAAGNPGAPETQEGVPGARLLPTKLQPSLVRTLGPNAWGLGRLVGALRLALCLVLASQGFPLPRKTEEMRNLLAGCWAGVAEGKLTAAKLKLSILSFDSRVVLEIVEAWTLLSLLEWHRKPNGLHCMQVIQARLHSHDHLAALAPLWQCLQMM